MVVLGGVAVSYERGTHTGRLQGGERRVCVPTRLETDDRVCSLSLALSLARSFFISLSLSLSPKEVPGMF